MHTARGASGSRYNIDAVGRLLQAAFSADELLRFCRANPAFQPLLDRFGRNASKLELIDVMLDYCQRHDLFEDLLAEVKKENPRQYEAHEADLLVPDGPWPFPQMARPAARSAAIAAAAVAGLAFLVVAFLVLRSASYGPGTLPAGPTPPASTAALVSSIAPAAVARPTSATLTADAQTGPVLETPTHAPPPELPPGTWPMAVGLAGLTGCSSDLGAELYHNVQVAFDPPPANLRWQLQPEQRFDSPEAARAWAAEHGLGLLIWGRCAEPDRLELMAELVDVPHAPEMAELPQVVAHLTMSRQSFYGRDLLIGLVAYAAGDYELAGSRWDVLAGVLEGSGAEPPEVAQLLLLRGNSRAYAGMYAGAVPLLEQVLSTNAPLELRVAAANNLGVAHLNQQLALSMEARRPPDLADAIRAFSTTLELDDNYVLAYLNRADAYRQLYDWPAARADCERALSLSSGRSAAALYCRGVISYSDPNSFSEAAFLADMEAALHSAAGPYATAYYMLASYYQDLGVEAQARQEYERFIQQLQSRPLLFLDERRIESARSTVGP